MVIMLTSSAGVFTMTRVMQSRVCNRILLLCVLASSLPAQAQLLSVDRLNGTAQLERAGRSSALTINDPLVDSDSLRVGPGSRLGLRLSSHGFLELGPGAELAIEHLPYASFAPELRTVLRLKRGFLRVVWNHPQPSGAWPLWVRLGALRASLAQGEYFFEAATPTPLTHTACIARGRIEMAEDHRGALNLRPSRCYRYESSGPQITEYAEHDWIAMRNQGALRSPGTTSNTNSIASTAAPHERKPLYEIENAPAPQLLMQADTVPLEHTTTETLFGEKEPDLGGMLAAGKPTPATAAPPTPTALTPVIVSANKSAAGGWILQVAAAAGPVEAEREAKKLRGAGYMPEIAAAEVKGRTWHRVRITGFASAADARKAAEAIKAKLGYTNVWIARVK